MTIPSMNFCDIPVPEISCHRVVGVDVELFKSKEGGITWSTFHFNMRDGTNFDVVAFHVDGLLGNLDINYLRDKEAD